MAVKKIPYLEGDVLCQSWEITMALDIELTCEPWIVRNSFVKGFEWDKRKHSKSKNKAKVKLNFFEQLSTKFLSTFMD